MLALICASTACTALVFQGFPTFFAFLQAEYGLTRAAVGLYSSAAEVGTFATFIVGGWAADAFGLRRVLVICQALIGLVCIGFALAPTYGSGLTVLLGFGLVFGFSSPAASLGVLYWFSARTRATAMGIRQTGVSIAGIASAALMPAISLAYGWRTGVALMGVANLVVAVLLLWYRDPPADDRRSPIQGRQEAGSGRLPRGQMRPSWSQLRPLMGKGELLVVNSFAIILFVDQYVVVGYLILYLHEHLEVSLVAGGFILAMAQTGGFAGRIAWGVISDRALNGRRLPGLQLAGGIAAALLAIVALLPAGTPFFVLVLLAMGLGFTAMAWHGLRQVLVLELVPREVAGLALGVSQTFAEIGPVFGPPLFGALADAAGYRPAWLVMAALTTVVTVAISFAVEEPRRVTSATAGQDS
ncbi:MAG: MFS transporter [Chloroflexi bacterium]|nr:MFS transporter [Chloroflexota bacterium]